MNRPFVRQVALLYLVVDLFLQFEIPAILKIYLIVQVQFDFHHQRCQTQFVIDVFVNPLKMGVIFVYFLQFELPLCSSLQVVHHIVSSLYTFSLVAISQTFDSILC